jgi:hypothetical protein
LPGFSPFDIDNVFMTATKRHRPFFFLLFVLAAGLLPSTVPAAFVFQLSQVGPDVVVTGSGTLNLTALSPPFGSGSGASGILPNGAVLAVNPAGISLTGHAGFSGPSSWGSGSLTTATSSSGDPVVISGGSGALFLAPTYVSGSPLSNSMIFTNTTFSDLGFTPGTYIYTWGSAASADSLTVTTVVPEPATWALLGLGVVMLPGLTLRSRRAMSA